MISLSRVGARLRRRNHRPHLLRAVVYLRYAAWRDALLSADIENLEDQEEWHRLRPKTVHITRVLPGTSDSKATVTMPTIQLDE